MRQGRNSVRWWSALASGVLLATLIVVVTNTVQPSAPERVGGSTYLCEGYAGCRRAGYSDDGYGAVNNRMYWRMYAGHNCTNYAAYRMIRAGAPAERPWNSSGMAYNWGHANPRITDKVPAVGAIAWWDRYHNGIGSSGHVAYVEEVVSDSEIVISEDSWGGTFHWRTITKNSGRWPSGFIHFADAGPDTFTNTKAPSVSGTPKVGQVLAADPGKWDPEPRRYAYQWSADGKAIDGATRARFIPDADQLGTQLTVAVTAKRPKREPASAQATVSEKVVRGEFANASAPVISGTAMIDEELVVTRGAFAPDPSDTRIFWKADGKRIPGANGERLLLTRDLGGAVISVVQVARRDGYVGSRSYSARTARVLVGEIVVDRPFTLTGRPELGHELVVQPGTYEPADAAVTYTWLRDGVAIPGATGTAYTPTAADLGATVSVRVGLARRNYASAQETAATTVPIRTRPSLKVVSVPRSGRVVVRVRMTAPGLTRIPGEVRVQVGKQVQEVSLTDGRARLRFTDLAAGRRTVRVVHAGATTMLPARHRETVRVPR